MAVELDGREWRTVPDAVVVRCGLRAGLELDRVAASSLARELRHEHALGHALRSLRSRPLSERRLRERLRSRGARPDAEQAALAMLADAGFVDDTRLARGRASALAERGWGDSAIAARLAGEGLAEVEIETAVGELEPEAVRAARLVAGLRSRPAWALLQRRGFGPDAIESVLGGLDEPEEDGLG